jgi:hypothetical protein
MAVMERRAWTDERLDDLNKKVDEGFKDMREEFRTVRSELGDVRTEMGALNRTVVQLAWTMAGTVFLGFCGTIAALITLA